MKLLASVQQSFLICRNSLTTIIQTAARKQEQRLAEEEKKKSEQMIREGKTKGGKKLSRLIHNHKETEKDENGENRRGFEKERHS